MKKILKIIVIIFIVLFLLGLILNWLAESYYKQGLEKSNKKEYKNGLYFYSNAIGLNKRFTKAYFKRGEAKFHLKDLERFSF